MDWWWPIATLAIMLVSGLYLSHTAGRLDRLHRKIDIAGLALDAQLLRRSSVSIELASSGVLDPATSVLLADAAHRARKAHDEDEVSRALAESELTAALDAALADAEDVAELRDDPFAASLLDELDASIRRVALARRFLNDAVRGCQLVRRHRAVRWFRLAGHTPMPSTMEMDDTGPAGL